VAPVSFENVYLGSGAAADRRQSPYFRTEWLQRVLNLTTVRTHQFAVWVTIGFFEVTRRGKPALATSDPAAAADLLGKEVPAPDGRTVRHRGFFVLDRSRASGFNPHDPICMENVIVYRRSIE
jgi:hypothetical protein